MALQGTLKDFGIAEILQLIGQQAKSGVLHLRSRDQEIHIAIADGNVVSAEHVGRRASDRLGTRLVRAGLLRQEGLDAALELQTRTLRRLGDLLVEMGLVSADDLRQMTALQTTETVYRLFHWKTGTYEFEPGAVDHDRATVTPLRADSLLMEGFRQVDEWPMVRRKISSPHMTFERLRELDPGRGDPVRTVTVSLGPVPEGDESFGGVGERSGERSGLGQTERRVYELTTPGRTAERIADLARVGEFETCKALLALCNLGYLSPVAPARRAAAEVYARGWGERVRRGVVGLAATVALAALLAGIGWLVARRGLAPASRLRDNAAERFLTRHQVGRLRGALEVYRLEKGAFPERLRELTEAGLAEERDLRYPWTEPYHYRRTAGGYVLLPPVE